MFSCVLDARQCRSPAALEERAVAQVHVGKPCHRFDREMIERHAVADFAEHLPDIAVEARFGLVGEAGEENAAARIDIVERVGGAGAHVEGAELARCVEAELHAVDAGAARRASTLRSERR